MQSHSVELFQKNFASGEKKKERTVLYGLGKMTEEILQAFPLFPVEGLLDGYRESGSFCGKKIISLNSLAGQDVQIIILARKASERIIFRRIQKFCREQNIPVYSLDGIHLGEMTDGGRRRQIEIFYQSSTELKEKLQEYDTVSFDVFDTLLVRKLPCQEDILSMSVKEEKEFFVPLRMRAEQELSRNGVPSIFDIYRWMGNQTEVKPEVLSEWLRRELETEKRMLRPRRAMIQILKEALSLGKSVYLISDMYLPGPILESFLEQAGIRGYHRLFVSCDYGTGKAGRLYDIYKENTPGKKRLHIGDSKELDGECARVHGLDAFLIESPEDMADRTELGCGLQSIDGNNRLQSMIYAGLLNNPFSLQNDGRLYVGWTDLGYGILGPVLAGYTVWLCEKLMERPVNHMLFVARDGYMVKKIFDRMKRLKKFEKLSESRYIRISRTFSVLASLETEEDVLWAFSLPFHGTAEEMLQKRFQMDKDEIRPYRFGEDEREYVKQHSDAILNRAGLARAAYRKYFSFLKSQETAGMFDFVSTGTCQMCLEKILNISVKGYYFERCAASCERKERLDIIDFVHEYSLDYESDNYFLLESWFKSTEPSVKRITQDGKILYCERHRTSGQNACIREVQQGALRFCRDYVELIEKGMKTGNIKEFAFHILPFINERFFHLELGKMNNFDEFSNRSISL